MSDAVLIALISGPAAVTLDRIITWFRNRNKEAAETGLAVDQRWENYADKVEERLATLEDRVVKLEAELKHERARAKGLEAEVDYYRNIARSLIRHVLRLREALAKTKVDIPSIPQDIEDALTGIDLP